MRTPSRLPRCGTQARAVHPGKQNPTFVGGIINSGPRLRSACDPALASARASEHRSSLVITSGPVSPQLAHAEALGAAVFCSGPIGAELIFRVYEVGKPARLHFGGSSTVAGGGAGGPA